MVIRNQRAFAAGVLFLIVSVFYFLMSHKYAMGTPARMGPGFFPRMVSGILFVIAMGIIWSAVAPRAKPERLERWDVKGLLWIAGSVALFAVMLRPPHSLSLPIPYPYLADTGWPMVATWWTPSIPLLGLNLFDTFGLVIALAVLIIVSSLASPEFTWIGTLVSTALLVVFCVSVFVYGISLQFPVWPMLAR
jgi:hypothetical protein